jgi:hypothetical protein
MPSEALGGLLIPISVLALWQQVSLALRCWLHRRAQHALTKRCILAAVSKTILLTLVPTEHIREKMFQSQ